MGMSGLASTTSRFIRKGNDARSKAWQIPLPLFFSEVVILRELEA